MPATLDVLIGFSVVMLVLALATTAFIQLVLMLNQLRGRELCGGLALLLRQLAPGLEDRDAREIARAVVKHPLLVSRKWQWGSVVQREELIELLLGLATEAGTGGLPEAARTKLQTMLRQKGITDPAGVLRNIRMTALKLEETSPGLAAHVRQTKAIVQEAASQFVAEVNGWFDRTMDRVSESFSANVQVITIVSSLALAITLQVDAFEIINRLALDSKLRETLVAQAGELVKRGEAGQDSVRANTPPDSALAATQRSLGDLRALATSRLITLPSVDGWRRSFWGHLGGILLSAVLIGLGAPFWFNTLKRLLNLRSSAAAKDDTQRAERAAATPEPTPPKGGRQSSGGEQGDLSAVG